MAEPKSPLLTTTTTTAGLSGARSRVSFVRLATSPPAVSDVPGESLFESTPATMGEAHDAQAPTSTGRRLSAWSKLKKPAAPKPKVNSIFDSIVSSMNTKSLVDEMREERLEEMEEAHELRSCSLSNVVSRFHPARNAGKQISGFSATRSLSFSNAVLHEAKHANMPKVAVTLERYSRGLNASVATPIQQLETFTVLDKIFFLFNGIPNALRSTKELEPWLVWSSIVSNFTLFIVVLSCVSFCIESLPELVNAEPTPVSIVALSYVCMSWLTFELLARLGCTRDLIGMLQMPLTWIDIVSNIPYYVELFSGQRAARVLILIRLLRLTRILRVFDLSKHNIGMQSVWGAITKSISGLTLFLLMLVVVLFMFSSVVWMAETTAESFNNAKNVWVYDATGRVSPFQSIPHTVWFVITTVTTVGYGDNVVVTPTGKAVASILILLGPFMIAFPTVILSANFQETHREILESLQDQTNTDLSVEEAKIKREKRTAEVVSTMKKYIPKSHVRDIRAGEALNSILGRKEHLLKYAISVGAPERHIVIRNDVAMYDPLLVLRCAHADGEPEYGFQSSTGVMMTVRDNYPSGSIVRVHVLLHTEFTQEAAIMAVHQHLKKFPSVHVTTVAPRPIRTLRVSFHSKHVLLSGFHVVCSKYNDPFGTIPVELVTTKPEALPALLRYSSSCSLTFTAEFHDSTEATSLATLSSDQGLCVQYASTDPIVEEMLKNQFPSSTVQEGDAETLLEK